MKQKQKSVKVSKETWKILTDIKMRDDRKTLGEVISYLLIKAKEVEVNDTQSNQKTD